MGGPSQMRYPSVNRFRIRRGQLLRRQIEILAAHLGRDITVLDVGGRPDYWGNVGLGRIARVIVMNYDSSELDLPVPTDAPSGMFEQRLGDARNLSDYADRSVDLVHSNSVIEHVGGWPDMRAMANELMRVGRSGWVQTPAWEFPIEPHFRAPFIHWFGRPMQARLMSLSFEKRIREMPLDLRRQGTDRINLLSRREIYELFPGQVIFTERLILAKSYVVRWMPEGQPVEGPVTHKEMVADCSKAADHELAEKRQTAA
jgi:Methyltransferase domain